MSHVEEVKTRVTDLGALKAACTRLGAEFVEGKKKYNWYGRSVGDYPLPAGFTADELGHCDHVVRIPGVNYEVGVVRAKDGKGYTMLYDFFGSQTGGKGHDGEMLRKRFGNGLTKLIDAYSLEALKAKARAKGYMSREVPLANGKTQLVVTVP